MLIDTAASTYVSLSLIEPLSFPKADKEFRDTSVAQLAGLFQKVIDELGVQRLAEIGARAAEASVAFCRSGEHRTALAFEANPVTFERYTPRLARFDRLEYRNLAITPQCGPVTINIPNPDRPMSGDVSLLTRVGARQGNAREVQVAGHTLSCVTHEHCDALDHGSQGGFGAFWIDVEGLSREVLNSSTHALKATEASVVFIELEDVPFWDGQALAGDIFSQLAGLGYVAVARDFQRDTQFNALFVREHLLGNVMRFVKPYWRDLTLAYTSRL